MSNDGNSRLELSPPLRWGLFAALLLILTIITVQIAPLIPRLIDFDQTFYPAARYTLAGENPYTTSYVVVSEGNPTPDFFSPAWLLLILLPFGLLPLKIAQAAWLLFLILTIIIALSRMQAWGFHGLRPFLLILLPWSLISLLFGQVTPLVLLGTIWAIELVYDGERTAVSPLPILKLAVAFLLIGLKPQLGIFIAAPLVLDMLWHRDRRLVGLAAIGLVILGITLLVTPPWLISKAVEVQKLTAPYWKSTLERELWLWALPSWPAQFMRLFVVGVMAYWMWLQKGASTAWWSAWLTAVLIITPYTRAYDGVLLLPLLGQLFIFRRWYFALFLLIVALYTQSPLGEMGSIITPLTAWFLFIPWRGLIHGSIPALYQQQLTPP